MDTESTHIWWPSWETRNLSKRFAVGFIPLAQGTILEICVGPGVNFVRYDPGKVKKIYALEPNPGCYEKRKNASVEPAWR